MVTEGNGVGVLSGMGVYKEQFSSTLTEKAGLWVKCKCSQDALVFILDKQNVSKYWDNETFITLVKFSFGLTLCLILLSS